MKTKKREGERQRKKKREKEREEEREGNRREKHGKVISDERDRRPARNPVVKMKSEVKGIY